MYILPRQVLGIASLIPTAQEKTELCHVFRILAATWHQGINSHDIPSVKLPCVMPVNCPQIVSYQVPILTQFLLVSNLMYLFVLPGPAYIKLIQAH